MHTALYEKLKQIKVIPVITINHAEYAVALAQVLIENGLPCAEVTFRHLLLRKRLKICVRHTRIY